MLCALFRFGVKSLKYLQILNLFGIIMFLSYSKKTNLKFQWWIFQKKLYMGGFL
jgi:hypothetical protein